MTNHTPTPWRIGDAGTAIFAPKDGAVPKYVASDLTRANAAFIVRACNSHEALLEACDLVQRAYVGDGIRMAEAVDACLLAIDLANKE